MDRRNQNVIECDLRDSWFHAKCINTKTTKYNVLCDESLILGMFEFFTSRVWYTSPKYSLIVHTCWRTQEKCRLLHDLESWIKEKKDESRSCIATSLSTLLMWLFFSKIHLLMCLQWLDRLWQSSYTYSTGYAVT